MNMDPSFDFEPIRPYRDDEVQAVLVRLSEKPSFLLLMQHLFPDQSPEKISEEVKHLHSTHDFQAKYIHDAIRGIVSNSTDGLSYEGFDQLDDASPCLFLSNHRDIILDSALLNILLFECRLKTSQVAIGDNLTVSPLVTDLMKLNKSFIVHRSPAPSQLRAYALRLSHYVRHMLSSRTASVWLAQRNGRAKDGHDQTQTSLLKMLCMSSDLPFPEALAALHIRPMVISYEYEPCLGLKAEELVHQALELPYTKDDKTAMIQGIRSPKGRVHLAIGPLLADELRVIPTNVSRKTQIQAAADLIDQHIYQLYRCWPTHYIAADLLEGTRQRAAHYTAAEEAAFAAHIATEQKDLKGPPQALTQQMIEIYARPVLNAEKGRCQN